MSLANLRVGSEECHVALLDKLKLLDENQSNTHGNM